MLALAGKTRRDQQVTITHTRQTRLELTSETLTAPIAPAHRPPAPLLPLIGREGEVADLLALLDQARSASPWSARPASARAGWRWRWRTGPGGSSPMASPSSRLADVTAAADVPYAFLRALGITPAADQPVRRAIAGLSCAPSDAAGG